MNINIDYRLKLRENEVAPSNQELTLNFLEGAVANAHPQGLSSRERRLWSRVQLKLDDAVNAKAYSIDLEKAEKDFILDCFKNAKLNSVAAKNIVLLEQELEKE